MESLIADFIQFSSAIAKFLFLQGRLGNTLLGLNFADFAFFGQIREFVQNLIQDLCKIYEKYCIGDYLIFSCKV